MIVKEIMRSDVRTMPPEGSYFDAARLLTEFGISSIVIVREDHPVGIVTERDVVHLVAEGFDPSSVAVGDRMTMDLATVEPTTDLAEAARLMALHRVRHLPVVEGEMLVGMISVRDLLAWIDTQLTAAPDLWPDIMQAVVTWPH
jgi:CBS domain-containing protein